MSYVLGIDFSTNHIDCVLLDETTNQATWHRFSPRGDTALERLRHVPLSMPNYAWYDQVYLAAIEVPYGRGQPGTQAKLNRVFGAICAAIPASVELWAVTPGEWRKELGLPGNAPKEECIAATKLLGAPIDWSAPDAYDAFAVAYFARETNGRALTEKPFAVQGRAA